MKSFCFVLLAAALPLAAGAQEIILSRSDRPEAGTRSRDTTEMTMGKLKMTAEAGGVTLLEAGFTGIGRVVSDVEYRSRDEVAVKMRRNRFSTKTEGDSMPGETEVEINPLEGVEIIGRRKDGNWTFTLASGKPTEQQQEELDDLGKSFDESHLAYPTEPVKVGHQWEVTGDRLAGLVGGSVGLEDLDGKMTLKIEGLEKIDGLECAKISVSGTAKFKFELDDDEEMEFPDMQAALTLKGTIFRSLEHGADLRVEMGGDIVIAGGTDSDEAPFSLNMKGPITILTASDFSPDDAPVEAEGEDKEPAKSPKKPSKID